MKEGVPQKNNRIEFVWIVDNGIQTLWYDFFLYGFI